MSKAFKPFRCTECGDTVRLETGPGRVQEYRRGLELPVPDSFAIPTCPTCGERYFTVERGDALAKAQKPLFAEWQRTHTTPLVEEIQKRHGVTLRHIEAACGVSGTYLSHVLAGRKEASVTLIRLLEAYARVPAEFVRQMKREGWKPGAEQASSSEPSSAAPDLRLVAEPRQSSAYAQPKKSTARKPELTDASTGNIVTGTRPYSVYVASVPLVVGKAKNPAAA
jgi:transcriptional regulator with XRE-family HTH domain